MGKSPVQIAHQRLAARQAWCKHPEWDHTSDCCRVCLVTRAELVAAGQTPPANPSSGNGIQATGGGGSAMRVGSRSDEPSMPVPDLDGINGAVEQVFLHDVIREHIRTISPKPGDVIVLTIPMAHHTPNTMNHVTEVLRAIIADLEGVSAMILPEGTTVESMPHEKIDTAQRNLEAAKSQLQAQIDGLEKLKAAKSEVIGLPTMDMRKQDLRKIMGEFSPDRGQE